MKKLGISIQNAHGHLHDNTTNISGKYFGLLQVAEFFHQS
jgi:hypothetical protein